MCNGPYHLYCLKPKLTEVPQGNWFCSTCKPQPKETKAVLGAEEDSEPIHQVDIVHNTNCLDCTGEQDENEFELISCASCPYVYHRSCHNPPLRNFPRGSWQCWRCHADNPVNVSDDKHEAALSTDKREGLRPSKSVDYREESRHSDDDKSTDERIAVEMVKELELFKCH